MQRDEYPRSILLTVVPIPTVMIADTLIAVGFVEGPMQPRAAAISAAEYAE